MVKNEAILIKDTKSKVWVLPVVIRRFFIKTYHTQGGVYIETIKPPIAQILLNGLKN